MTEVEKFNDQLTQIRAKLKKNNAKSTKKITPNKAVLLQKEKTCILRK